MPLLYSIDQAAAARLNRHNDHGFWFEQKVHYDLPHDFALWYHSEQRWGDDYRQLWYYEFELNFQYNLTQSIRNKICNCSENSTLKWFSVGIAYAPTELIEQNTLGVYKWVSENKYFIEGNLTLSLNDWELKQRIRGEYRDYASPHYKDYGDCRYLIALFTPGYTCLKIQAYIWNEFFFRNNTYHTSHPTGRVGGWYQNRFRVGLTSHLWDETLTCMVWYQWRFLKQKPGTCPGRFDNLDWGATIIVNF